MKITNAIEIIKSLLTKKQLKECEKEKQILEAADRKETWIIPEGVYCYNGDYQCPYWDSYDTKPDQ